ncbi:hypothetical protein I3842_09G028000 [Carya illinoinensis]|uniref:Mic1 domain-containing protein n=1 Tax=Carya illinoinensis TaxID=32201 RepID=A0A922J6N5_CARIL|nr:hypothetical protein I3842_09G028000 [Carya illinoinensis]
MSGKASSSQPSVRLSGSGGLSHVYIQYPPLRCNISGSRGLFYDDGNKLLHSPTSDRVFSWKTVPFSSLADPISDLISEGPILSIRYSLDEKFIAVQRSNHDIQFWHRETGETFSQRCRSESESILGFFWTDCPLCDIVFVKTSGLDFFAYNSESKLLHLVETRKLNVSWYVYTHESRLVLLASGMQCKTFNGFQLSSMGIIRLPRFEMAMAKPEADSKPVLAAEDIFIITVYGRIYCVQVDRVAMLLHLYRFYRDAVVQQGSLPIYSSRISVSVVDNVLLVHQVDAKVVILYDIFADSQAPISAPLPLLLRDLRRYNSSASQSGREDCESSEANILEVKKAKQLCLAMARTVILERRPVAMVARAMDVLVTSYSHSIKMGSYLKGIKSEKALPSTATYVGSPSSAADTTASRMGVLGRSAKHESAASADSEHFNRTSTFSTSDTEENASFEPPKTNPSDIQSVDSRMDVGANVQTSSSQHHLLGASNTPLDANVSEQQEELTSPAIAPDEMYGFVFTPVEEEMVGDPSYLVAIIVEFLHSANSEKIKVHPNLYVLTIQLLARNERYTELGLFVINKILEPSKEVALQLLESGRQNIQTRKLGLDMLRQLSLHHDYVLFLVQDGYYLEALRYARKYKVNTVRPSLFLEAAYASNDSQRLAAVLRFFSDFIPGFQNTSDHNTYYRILNEMSSSIAGHCF